MLTDKHHLSPLENHRLLAVTLPALIYANSKFEGVTLSQQDVCSILDGHQPPKSTQDDLLIITNLQHAWHLVLTCNETFTLTMACRINAAVAENDALAWGQLRDGQIYTEDAKYVPNIPNNATVSSWIDTLMTSNLSATEKALRYMLRADREQLFWDGNKRTSIVAANYIMINAGAGLVNITEAQLPEWNRLLTAYYETGDDAPLLAWLYENCIHGLTRQGK